MQKSLLIVLAVASLPAIVGCTATDIERENKALQNRLQLSEKDRSQLSTKCAALDEQVKNLQSELNKSKAQERNLNDVLKQLQDAQQAREKQVAELKALVKDMSGMSVESRPEGDFIVIENKILFALGKADLSDDAKKVLDATVVAYLKKHPEQAIRIDGHTDGVPITHSGWEDNHHLSVMRALHVMQYMASKGTSVEKMQIMGYGPNRPRKTPPKADADVAENRRVEILIMPATGQKSIEDILKGFQK